MSDKKLSYFPVYNYLYIAKVCNPPLDKKSIFNSALINLSISVKY
mgnify:FL=1